MNAGLSIDEWLGAHRRNDFKELGRFLISRCISRHEKILAFEKADHEKRHWYAKLWEKIRPRTLDELSSMNVTFITFNYDRSLEHALITMARATYCSNNDHESMVNSIPIIHVHGQLGRLEWQTSRDKLTIRKYGEERNASLEHRCDSGIHFLGDEAAESDFDIARAHLQRANEIHFLGFGFHPDNLKRFSIDQVKAEVISGTCIGIGSTEYESLSRRFGGRLFLKRMNIEGDEGYIHHMLDRLENSGTQY